MQGGQHVIYAVLGSWFVVMLFGNGESKSHMQGRRTSRAGLGRNGTESSAVTLKPCQTGIDDSSESLPWNGSRVPRRSRKPLECCVPVLAPGFRTLESRLRLRASHRRCPKREGTLLIEPNHKHSSTQAPFLIIGTLALWRSTKHGGGRGCGGRRPKGAS